MTCNATRSCLMSVCGLLIACAATTVTAGTLTLDAAVPAVGDGVQNLNFSTSAGDNTMVQFVPSNYIGQPYRGDDLHVGQSFTTGVHPSGYTLSSISVRQVSWESDWDFTGGSLNLKLFNMGAGPGPVWNSATQLASETATAAGTGPPTIGGTPASPQWLTFTLDSPLVLDPNTLYGFSLGASGGIANEEFFMNLDGTSGNSYADGFAFTIPEGASSSMWDGDNGQPSDRAFVAAMMELPANEWNVDANGSWDTASNWTLGVPSPNSDVVFGDIITSNTIVTLDVSPTVGGITFDNVGDGSYSIVPSTNQTLSLGGSANITVSGQHSLSVPVGGSFGLNKLGSGDLILDAANNYDGVTHVINGTLTAASNTALGISNGVIASGSTIDGGTSTGKIALTSGSAIGDELLSLGARQGAASDAPHLTSAGANSWAGNIKGEAGGTQYNFESTSGTLTVGGTVSAPNTGASNLVFKGAGQFNVTGKITDVDVDEVGDTPLDPEAAMNSETNVNVLKQGNGTLTIATASNVNADYWFGTTTIESGDANTGKVVVLADNPSDNNGELRSSVEVQQGAMFDVSSFGTYNFWAQAFPGVGLSPASLSGGGTVAANTINLRESNVVSPGDSVGTLKVSGNLGLIYTDDGDGTIGITDTGSFNFELGDDPSISTIDNTENDLISVSGALSVNTNSLANQFVVNVQPVDGMLGVTQNYVLARANTLSLSGGAADTNFAVNIVDAAGAPIITRQSGSVVLNTAANQIELSVSGGPLSLAWNGPSGGVWNVNNAASWTGGDTVFYDRDSVSFNGTAPGTVSVGQTVAPNAMTVSTAAYTFEGSDINAQSVTVGTGGTATINNSIGGNVTVQSTGTVAGAGTLKDDLAVQSGGMLRVGEAAMPVGFAKVSFNITGDFNSVVNGTAGVGAAEAANWNNAPASSGATLGGTFSDLMDDFGASTTLDVTVAGAFNTFQVVGPPGPDADTTWNRNMLNSYVNSGNGNPGSFTLAEIPFEGYDIYVYFASDVETRSGSVTDGTTTYYWNALDGQVAGANALFAQTTSTTDGVFPEANYAVFSGLSGTDQVISGSTLNDFVGMSAIQIVSTSTSERGEILTVQGDASLSDGSTAAFNLAGSGVNDLLDVGGNLLLEEGAIIDLTFAPGVDPTAFVAGDSWDLLNFASNAGSDFDVNNLANFFYTSDGGSGVGLPSLAANLNWDTSAFLTEGVLAVISDGLPGDYNGDNKVDAADYAVWRNGDSPDSSQAGYLLWRSNYGASTTVVGASEAAAPEPGCMALLVGLIALGAAPRRRAL